MLPVVTKKKIERVIKLIDLKWVDLQKLDLVLLIRGKYYDSKLTEISPNNLPKRKILITVNEGRSNFVDEMLMDMRKNSIEHHDKERLYSIHDNWDDDENS